MIGISAPLNAVRNRQFDCLDIRVDGLRMLEDQVLALEALHYLEGFE